MVFDIESTHAFFLCCNSPKEQNHPHHCFESHPSKNERISVCARDPPSVLIKVQYSKALVDLICVHLPFFYSLRNYKVAKPEWVVESVKANRLLSWHNFSTLRTPMSLTKFGVSITEASSSSPSPKPVQEATAAMSHEPTPEPAFTKADMDLSKDPSGDADEEEALNDQEEESQSWEGYGLDEELFFDDDALMDDHLDPMNLDNDVVTATTDKGPSMATVIQPSTTNAPTGLQPPIVPGYKVIPPAFNPYAKTIIAPPTSSIEGDDRVPGSGLPEQNNNGEVDTRHPTLIELSVPWNRLNSSIQPGFVEKFYQSSRLHYLSTWKAKLREITTDIQKDRAPVTSKFKNRTIM